MDRELNALEVLENLKLAHEMKKQVKKLAGELEKATAVFARNAGAFKLTSLSREMTRVSSALAQAQQDIEMAAEKLDEEQRAIKHLFRNLKIVEQDLTQARSDRDKEEAKEKQGPQPGATYALNWGSGWGGSSATTGGLWP